jgi:hypothetical protein
MRNDCSYQSSTALCCDVRMDFAPRHAVLPSVGDRHDGIEMRAGDATEREDKRDEDRACRDCVGEECQSYVRPGEAFSHVAGTYHSGDEEEGSYKLSGYSSL